MYVHYIIKLTLWDWIVEDFLMCLQVPLGQHYPPHSPRGQRDLSDQMGQLGQVEHWWWWWWQWWTKGQGSWEQTLWSCHMKEEVVHQRQQWQTMGLLNLWGKNTITIMWTPLEPSERVWIKRCPDLRGGVGTKLWCSHHSRSLCFIHFTVTPGS